jgi:hypothetical protein
MNPEFKERLDKYLAGVREKVAYNLKQYSLTATPEIKAAFGERYVKVYRLEIASNGSLLSRSVHSFVDQTNGDVLKAASWRSPAKHARGNIYDADYGLSRVTAYGPEYLR